MPTFGEIGAKFLAEGLHLTALELHAELLESKGKDLTILRDFFSNPINFEPKEEDALFGSNLARSSSMQTFDSLDLARGSDDGQERVGDERIAVLEFELRKAKEEIRSLRATLTAATTTELSLDRQASTDSTCTVRSDQREQDFPGLDEPLLYQCPEIDAIIKPHERRALNYLVNEFLMQFNCKLTAITFSDENQDCDYLDSWDLIGLNIPKPPDLLHLYRFYLWSIYAGKKYFEKLRQKANQTDNEAQTNNESYQRLSNYHEVSTQTELPRKPSSDSVASDTTSAASHAIFSGKQTTPSQIPASNTGTNSQLVDDMKSRMRGLFSKK